ncbi:MAG: hypothetical protein ACR2PL_26635 [Dehalococcoidia bacterium]
MVTARLKTWLLSVLLGIGLLAARSPIAAAQAPGNIPAARFYGTIVVNGALAGAGTTVTVQNVDSGASCGTGGVSDSSGSYFVDVESSSGCAGPFVFLINGQRANEIGTLSGLQGTPVHLNLTLTTIPVLTVTYQAGWNLVSGPAGTIVAGTGVPLYTYQAGDTAYEVIPSGTPLQAGIGYWAYFDRTTAEPLPNVGQQSITRYLPAGRFSMIGNPGNLPVSVSGADLVYIYDQARGYLQATVLQPGQGAWAYSAAGATVTISPR